MRKLLLLIISTAALSISASTFAGEQHDHEQHANMWAEGVVKKVDLEKGHIKIKHGPISHMNIPPMTMSFKVSDESLLTKVKKEMKLNLRPKNPIKKLY